MALLLSSTAIAEKNKLASGSVWIVCLEITIPGVATPVRVCANGEDITWRGETWQAFPFEISEIGDTAKAEVPSVQLRISNVSRAIEAYLHDYDAYCKTSGYRPVEVVISVVNSLNLAAADAEVEHLFELKQPKTDSKWATFTLGAANPFNRRFPPSRMLQNHCRYKFKDARCGYAGAQTACNKTLARCREIGNSPRFGGAPGIGRDGIMAL